MTQYCGKLLPLPQTNENRLNHGQNLRKINLTDQESHDSGNDPFKKTKNMPITLAMLLVEKSAKIVFVFPNYAKTYASTIDKRLGRPQNGLSPVPDVVGKVSRGSHKSTHRIYSLDDATLLARGELESNAHLLTLPRSPRMERHSAGCSSHEQTF